jgi:hypothetical protein
VGYGGELIERPEQQAALRRIRALRAQGASLRAIAAALAQDGHHLSHVAIRSILGAGR